MRFEPRAKRPIGLYCAGTVAAVYLVLLLAPLSFRMPAADLDSSAHFTVAYAFVSGWQWGRDIIFAFAPLGFIFPRPFLEGTLLITVLFWVSMGLGLAFAFLTFARTIPKIYAVILFVAFAAPLPYSPDAVFFAVPILAAIAHLANPGRAQTGIFLFLAVIAGVGALVKLSFAILALVIVVGLDLDQIRLRRIPRLTAVFLVTFVLSYLLAGQDLRYVVPFILQSIEQVNGYTEAMQLWGSTFELVLFLATSAIVACAIAFAEILRVGLARPIFPKVVFCAISGLVLLMLFKAGFVRQDLHTLNSWAGLSICLTAYAAAVWSQLPRSTAIALVGLSVVLAAAPAARVRSEIGRTLLVQRAVLVPLQQLSSIRDLIANPNAWLAQARETANAHSALVRRQIPLSPLDGSADVIASVQGAMIANGLNYRPRPNIQEYGAYTPKLTDVNLEFIRSERAPKYVLHNTGTIDNGYPSLADGPMWPEFLRLYAPLRFEGKYLLLQRRPRPASGIMSEPVSITAKLGEELIVANDGPKFITIQPQKTLLGRLAQFLFKPGMLSLRVKLADGSERAFRIVPGIASKGFVLSPLIEDNVALAALFFGYPEQLAGQNVVSIRVDVDSFSAYVFKPTVDIQMSTLLAETWRVALSGADISSVFASRRRLVAAVSSASGPDVRLEGDQLYAHAPSRASIPNPGPGKLTVGFGMRDGAWHGGGNTDGACFRILVGDDLVSAEQLWQRCLHPVTQADDRGPQIARLDLDERRKGQVFFETTCGDTCNWDWTYWNRIDLAPQ